MPAAPTAIASARSEMAPATVVLLLSLLLGIQPVTTDLYLPALTEVMMLAAFAVGGWVGLRLDGTVFALTNGLWFWSTVIAALSWTLVQRHGEPHRL